MIPEHIKTEIEEHLDQEITSSSPQSGGDINQAAILTFDSGNNYFLKWNTSASDLMFNAEAKGLNLLSDAETSLLIPKVILVGKDFLLLSLIDSETKSATSDFNFGVELAKLHHCSASSFGLDHNNFIGKLPQSNLPHEKWSEFFISERIEPQIKMGIDSGKFSSAIFSLSDNLQSVVENLFSEEKPALLHGDLWSGNYMYTKNGTVSIYDPAVYYGHREMDLAMTRLFSGFPQEFYAGYESEYPLAEGFDQRISLCNLYPILVHANLFGGGYIGQAESILNKFYG